jgi:CheY-like chemotaxis protein
MLAHELRNPLAAVRNAVTLATRSGTREDLEWSRDVTARQVQNFAHLIDDLLDVSRIGQGKIQLRKELVDAVPIIHHAVEAVRPLVEERKHELLLSFTSTDLRVEADTTRLEQMLVNLLANAAKYTPSGGRIQLIAGVEGDEILFRVRDNGDGISPELLPRMFELFVQADRSLARSEGGLGIGLTLVRSLAELHGGSIAATSDGPERGANSCSVSPPCGPPPARDPARRPAPRGPPRTLASARRGRQRGLGERDGEAAEAVGAHRPGGPQRPGRPRLGPRARPEVVVLDIGLPGMDGYEVAARLRREDCGKGAVIIAVTGYGEEQPAAARGGGHRPSPGQAGELREAPVGHGAGRIPPSGLRGGPGKHRRPAPSLGTGRRCRNREEAVIACDEQWASRPFTLCSPPEARQECICVQMAKFTGKVEPHPPSSPFRGADGGCGASSRDPLESVGQRHEQGFCGPCPPAPGSPAPPRAARRRRGGPGDGRPPSAGDDGT